MSSPTTYTIAEWLAARNGGTEALLVYIQDTAANIQAQLATLNTDTHISKIIVSDSATNEIVITAAQITGVSKALSLLKNADGTTAANVIVSDTAANISSKFGTIATDTQANLIEVSDNGAVTLTASQIASNLAAVAKLYNSDGITQASITAKDTATNIAAKLDQIQSAGGRVASVVVSNNVAVALTAAQFLNDATTLAKVGFNNGGTTNLFTISDTGAAFSGSTLDSIAASSILSKVKTITVTSGAITVSVSQITSDASLLTKIGTYSLTVNDSVATIQSALDSLQANSHVSSITLVDASPTLTISATTYANDWATVAKIASSFSLVVNGVTAANVASYVSTIGADTFVGSFTLNVADTAANIGTSLNSLETNVAHLGTVTVSNNAALTVSVAQITSDADVLAKTANADTTSYTLVVSDTGASVSSGLDSLASNSHVATITVSDNAALTVSVAQITSDAAALAKTANADTTAYTLNVTDSAAHISTGLDALQSNAHVSAITVSDNAALTVSIAQITSDSGALAKAVNADSSAYTLGVNDSAANIAIGFHTLASDSHVASITIADNAALDLSVAQIAADGSVLSKVSNADHSTYHVTASGSAASTTSALDTLQGLGSHLTQITLTDGGTPSVSISEAVFNADLGAIAKIVSSFDLTVTSNAADAATIAGNSTIAGDTHVNSFHVVVSDTAANVTSALDSLEGVASTIASIQLNDLTTPTISVSETTFTSDWDAIALISTSFNLTVTGVSAADAITFPHASDIASDSNIARLTINVGDGAGNVVSHLDGLEGIVSRIGTITFTDVSEQTVVLDEGTFNSDLDALAKIGTDYFLQVTGVVASDVGGVAASASSLSHAHNLRMYVNDSAANVQSALNLLESAHSAIASITLTDSSPAITVSETTFNADSDALLLIASDFSLTVTGVAAAAATGIVSASSSNGHIILSLDISDTSAAVQSALNSLQSVIGLLGTITLTDDSPAFTVTKAAYNADVDVFRLIDTPASLTVTGVLVADVAGIATSAAANMNLTLSLNVSDTAAHLVGALDSLAVYAGVIGNIALTDSGTPTISVSETTFNADWQVISEIGTPFNLTVNGVKAAHALSVANSASVASDLHISTYTVNVSDTSAAVHSNLDGLEIVAATIGTITLTDSSPSISITASTFANDSSALLKIVSDVDLTVTGAGASAVAGIVSTVRADAHISLLVDVSDSGANVASALDTLESNLNYIGTIALTGSSPALTVTADQLGSDWNAIAKIGTPFSLTITEVAADGAVDIVSASTINGDINISSFSVYVSDTAANVQANLDALESVSPHIGAITLTDDGTPTITVDEAAFTNDLAALSEITTPFNLTVTGVSAVDAATVAATDLSGTQVGTLTVDVSDFASNVMGNLDSLEGIASKLGTITLSDVGAVSVSLSESTFNLDWDALAKIGNDFTLTIGVNATDAAAVVTKAAGNSHITSVLQVTDTAANVQSALNSLESVVSHISYISYSDTFTSTISVTEATFTADLDAILKISRAFYLEVHGVAVADISRVTAAVSGDSHIDLFVYVGDTAANVQASLDTLQSHFNTYQNITLTDVLPPTISVTAATALNDYIALLKIVSSYNLDVSGATTANASAIISELGSNGYITLDINISDTVAHVQSALSSLETNVSDIGRIAFTDVGTQTFTVSATTFSADIFAIAKITSNMDLVVTGVSAANAATVAGSAITGQSNIKAFTVDVTDTASNVQSHLGSLEGVVGSIGTITLNDGGTPNIVTTADTFAADKDVLAKIVSNFELDVTGAAASDVAGIVSDATGNTHLQTLSIDVSDSVDNVQSALDALQDNATYIDQIVLSDGSPVLTIDAATFARDWSAISEISSSFALTVTGVLAADAATVLGNVGVGNDSNIVLFTVDVSDTAANVQSNLNSLQNVSGNIGFITLTDAGPHNLSVDAATFANDFGVLSQIATPFNLTVTGVTAANAVSVADTNIAPTSINAFVVDVSDSASDIVAHLSDLESVAGRIGTITLTDSGEPTISIGATAFLASADAFAKISSNYFLNVPNATAAQAADVASLAGSLTHAQDFNYTITDTAANVSANLDSIESASLLLFSITLSDGTKPTITVTESKFGDDLAALLKIVSDCNLTVTGVTASLADRIASSASSNAHFNLTMNVSDTAENIQSNLDTLASVSSHIGVITLSIPSGITVAADTFVSDWSALAKINSYFILTVNDATVGFATTPHLNDAYNDGNIAELIVNFSDTSSAVQGALGDLEAITGFIGSITLTDSSPAITVDQATFFADKDVLNQIASDFALAVTGVAASDANSVVSGISGNTHASLTIDVSDTASNVQGVLDSLHDIASAIGTITLTDTGVPTITVSGATFNLDSDALLKIGNDFNLTVTDVAAADAAGISSSIASDSHIHLTLEVRDSAAHVQAALNSLEGIASQIDAITLIDGSTPTISVLTGTFSNDWTALTKITSDFHLAVSGVAANTATTLALQIGTDSHITGFTLNITDSAAQVQSHLADLEAEVGHIGTIAFTDLGTPTITVSASTFASGLSAIVKIGSVFNLTVTGVSAADAVTVAENATVAGDWHIQSFKVGITDTSTNVESAFGSLETVKDNIGAITFSDGTVGVAVSYETFAADWDVISKISTDIGLSVTDVLASDAASTASTISGDSSIISYTLEIVDTSANVQSALDSLQSINSHINSIVFTDGIPSLSISEPALNADGEVLGKIGTDYNLTVTSTLAADVATVISTAGGLPHVSILTVDVSDTAAHVQSALGSLQSNLSDLGTISLSDSSPAIAISGTTFDADWHVLRHISNDFGLMVNDAVASDVSSIVADMSSPVIHIGSLTINVLDSAANVQAALDDLESQSDQIGTIALTGGGTPTITLTETQFTFDSDVLGKIASDYNLDVTDVLAADANNVGSNSHVAGIVVSDSGTAISAELDSLNGNSKVTSIVVNDSSDLQLSAHDATHDAHAISLISGANSISASDTAQNIAFYLDQLNGVPNLTGIVISDSQPLELTAAQVEDTAAIANLSNADSSGVTIDVTDTAANISAHLDALNDNADLASVTISDTPAITLTVDQLGNDLNIIGLLQSSNPELILIVRDTAENIASNATTIAQTDAVTAVQISDGNPLVLSALQYGQDSGLFTKLANSHGSPDYTVTVEDNAANISANLDQVASDDHVTNIVVDGADPLTLTVAQVASDTAALAKVSYSPAMVGGYAISVNDTAENISAGFNALNDNAHVTQIVVTDSGTPADVTLSTTDALRDTTAESLLYQADGVTRAEISVSDSASAISSNLDDLVGLASDIHQVLITDGGSNALTLNAQQVGSDAAILAKISGSYAIAVTDTAANIGAALDGLEANGHVTSITVSDNSNVLVSVSQLTSDAGMISVLANADSSPTHVTVADTANAIATDIGALNADATVNKIIVTNSAGSSVTLNVFQAVTYTTVESKLYQADGVTPAMVVVSDSALHIGTSFDSLNGNTRISKIVVGNSPVAEVILSAASAAFDTTAESKLYTNNGTTPAHVKILDTPSDILAVLDDLHGNSHVDQISLVASTTLALSVTKFVADSDVIAKIVGTYILDLSGTASQISAALDALEGNTHLSTITITDNAAITMSVHQWSTYTDLTGLLANANSTDVSLVVQDTSANISDALSDLSLDTAISSIVVSPNEAVTIPSITALLDDAHGIDLIAAGTPDYTLAVSDLAANITGAGLDALETYAALGHVASVSVTDDAELSLSAFQIARDLDVFGVMVNGDNSPFTVAVTDTAANVVTFLNALYGIVSHIDSINLTDSLTPTLTIAGAGFSSEWSVLTKVVSNFELSVGGVLTADVTSIASTVALDSHVSKLSLDVVDSSAHVLSALDALHGLGSIIHSIALTDGGTPNVSVSASDFANDSDVFGRITTDFNLTVTGVAAADAVTVANNAAVAGNTHAVSFAVNVDDTAAAVTAHLNDFEGVATKIGVITLNDATTPTLTITEGIFIADLSVITKIHSTYNVVMNQVQAADAATLADDLSQLHAGYGQYVGNFIVNVSDSAAHVQTSLNSLEGINSVLGSVTITGVSPAITVSESIFSSDKDVLAKIVSAVGVTVTGVLAADAADIVTTLAGNSNITPTLDVSDTSTSVQASLNSLEGIASDIGSIAFTDGSPAISVSEDTFNADQGALGKIVTNYHLTVSGAPVSDMSDLITTALGLPHIGSFTLDVTDSAANVQAGLGSLQGVIGYLGAITLTDLTTPTISVSETAFNSDLDTILKIASSFQLTVNNVLAADAAGIANASVIVSDSHITTIAINVNDSSIDVQSSLGSLAGVASKIATITLSDVLPAITVGEAGFTSDWSAIAKIVTDFSLTVNSVAASDSAVIVTTAAENAHISLTVDVSDLAASVQSNLDTLESVHSKIGTISLTDVMEPTITVTGAKFDADSDVFGLITSAFNLTVNSATASDASSIVSAARGNTHLGTLTVNINDTAANVQTALDSLATVHGSIGSISLSDNGTPTITLPEGEFLADWSAISLINSSFNLVVYAVAADAASIAANAGVAGDAHIVAFTVNVIDSSAEVQAHLSDLEGVVAKLGSVTLNDSATPTLSVTEAAFNAGRDVIAKVTGLYGSYSLVVNGVIAADAVTVAGGAHVGTNHVASFTVNVSDTAANVQARIASLQSVQAAIGAITLTDVGTPTISVSKAAFNADWGALSKIGSSFHLTVTGVLAADAAGIASSTNVSGDSHITGFTVNVNDTAAHVQGSIAALEGVVSSIGTIILTDGSTPTITLTETAFNADKDAVHKIGSNFKLTLNAVSAADAAGIAANLASDSFVTTLKLNVSDAAAQVAASLNVLQGIAANIGTVTLTDNAHLVLTGAQIVSDAALLANVVNANGSPIVIDITDTAAHLTASGVLDAIEANNFIGTVTVSNASSLTLNAATVDNDSDALAAAVDSHGNAITVTVSDTGANIRANLGTLNADTQVTSIIQTDNAQLLLSVSQFMAYQHALSELTEGGTGSVQVKDTAAALQGDFDQLQALSNIVKNIVVSNSVAMVLTAEELANDITALNKITNKNGSGVSYSVSDTAAQISTYIDSLQTNRARMTSITVSDHQAIQLTSTQFNTDSVVFTKSTGNVEVDVSGYTGVAWASAVIDYSDGVISSKLFKNGDGSTYQNQVFTYNQNFSGYGFTLTGVTKEVITMPGAGYNEADLYSNANGRTLEVFKYSGQPFDTQVQSFDSQGRLVTQDYYNGSSVYQNIHTYYGVSGFGLTGLKEAVYTNVSGASYIEQDVYSLNGTTEFTVQLKTGNVTVVTGSQSGLTFSTPTGGATTYSLGSTASDTFNFSGSFGMVTINGFNNGGHDSVNISTSAFSDFNSMLAHTAHVGSNEVITVDSNDTITLSNMTLAQLQSHASDFHFVT